MNCKNTVVMYIPKGYDYRPVTLKCGNTNIYGEQEFCENCEQDSNHAESIDADNAWLRSAGWGEI